MLIQAKEEDKENIRRNNLYGIELRDDMFSIATTNMILRCLLYTSCSLSSNDDAKILQFPDATKFQRAIRLVDGNNFSFSEIHSAVSYTHLDVYKRQEKN